MPSNGFRQVTLESRGRETVEVSERDAEFLKLADAFVMRARRVAKDPKRKKPRLRTK